MSANEQEFFKGLHNIYSAITEAPAYIPAVEVRKICDQLFSDVFDLIDYRIDGTENLPSKSGNIFILNHHRVHPFYTLQEGFQLTLDTHFVAAKLCYVTAGKSAIRIVRQGRATERAHSRYFSRLGHIFVNTRESDPCEESPVRQTARREKLFSDCDEVLASGTDLILCPEGTSYPSEASPGEFKPGAFQIAARAATEPLIVPVAIANFDKRLHNHRLAVVVKEPFRVSDKVDVTHRTQLREFLLDYQQEYQTYVEEAKKLAAG